jgi:integrase
VRLVDNHKPRAARKVAPDMVFIGQFRQLAAGHLYEFAADLALGIGLRRSEIAGLRFSDFDFLAGTLTLHRRIVRYTGQDLSATPGLKSRDERIEEEEVLPLPNGAPWTQLLETHRTRVLAFHMQHRKAWKGLDPRDPDAYVFPTEKGGPIDPGYLTNWFRELADQLGEQHSDKTFHWLRHTFVNKQFEANLTLEQVAALARHKDQNVTIQVYRHMSEQQRTALFTGSADWLYADQLQDAASSE